MVAAVTITLSTLATPNQKGAPSQVNKDSGPSVVQIATAKAKEPAKALESPDIQSTPIVEAPAPEPEPAPVATRTISGSKADWLAASGIPESEWQYVDYIVGRESGWDPCAYNPGYSDCNANPTSACGLAQSLPCGKQSAYGHWTDPVANLKWQYDYVRGRYGGYAQAYAFWTVNHWY